MNSRAKGKRGELELAHFLAAAGHPAHRGQQFSGGTDSPDVVCPSLAHIHIECKRVESGNPYQWLAQAARDAGPQRIPVVFHRRNDEEWVVVLRAADFLPLAADGATQRSVQSSPLVEQTPHSPAPVVQGASGGRKSLEGVA